MLSRFFWVLLAIVVLALVVPPVWFTLMPGPPPPDLPPPGQRVELPGGVGVNVVEAGSGPPVVLVHGLPGSAYDWRELQPELAANGMRAIAYGRVGYGRSDPRPDDGGYTPDTNAAELLALIDVLGLEQPTVVGWSYGGVTAILATLRDPGRIGRLVLVGTGGPDSAEAEPPTPPAVIRLLYSTPVLRWRIAVPPIGVALMEVLSDAAFSGGPQPDWWMDGLRGNFARWDTLMAYRGEMFGVEGTDATPFEPEAVATPTLLIHGDDDRLAPVAIARYLDTVIPDSELVVVPGGSHMLPVTWARELARRIASFSEPRTPGRDPALEDEHPSALSLR